jgi:hypothetical protein
VSSTVPTTTRTAERVIERMTPGLHAMLDRMTDRRIAELPMYASAASGSRDVVWKLVAANVHEVFDRLTGRRDDLSAAERSGRLRAQQGLALADLLTSFRMGYDEVWEAMIAAARTPPAIPADDMVDLSHLMFRLHNQVGDALIHAYREEAQHILLSRERERAALVNVLLSEATSVGTVIEIAGMLRLPMDGTFVVGAAAAPRRPGSARTRCPGSTRTCRRWTCRRCGTCGRTRWSACCPWAPRRATPSRSTCSPGTPPGRSASARCSICCGAPRGRSAWPNSSCSGTPASTRSSSSRTPR